jgi:hypothetical protein
VAIPWADWGGVEPLRLSVGQAPSLEIILPLGYPRWCSLSLRWRDGASRSKVWADQTLARLIELSEAHVRDGLGEHVMQVIQAFQEADQEYLDRTATEADSSSATALDAVPSTQVRSLAGEDLRGSGIIQLTVSPPLSIRRLGECWAGA